MAPILVDAGPLVSLLSDSQQHHEICKKTFAALQLPLLTCLPVLTEAAYLLRNYPQQVRKLLSAADGGFLRILSIDGDDMPSINKILAKYEDQAFQFADACLMHLANRESIDTVFTLDVRDFSVYRNPKGRQLSIIPALVD